MVQLNLYENSAKNQTIRTLLSLAIFIPSDIIYLFISEGSIDRLKKHFFAYFNVWITISIVFGVSILNEIDYKTNLKNYALYGLLIGLLIYVPLYNWIISCGNITGFNRMLSLSNICFGVLISSFTCIMIYIIEENYHSYTTVLD